MPRCLSNEGSATPERDIPLRGSFGMTFFIAPSSFKDYMVAFCFVSGSFSVYLVL